MGALVKIAAVGLNRSGIWTVLLGSTIVFGTAWADGIKDERYREATKATLVYASTALGVAVNTRGKKA